MIFSETLPFSGSGAYIDLNFTCDLNLISHSCKTMLNMSAMNKNLKINSMIIYLSLAILEMLLYEDNMRSLRQTTKIGICKGYFVICDFCHLFGKMRRESRMHHFKVTVLQVQVEKSGQTLLESNQY